MMMLKRLSLFLLVGATLLGGLDLVVGPLIPGGFSLISTAQAEVGVLYHRSALPGWRGAHRGATN